MTVLKMLQSCLLSENKAVYINSNAFKQNSITYTPFILHFGHISIQPMSICIVSIMDSTSASKSYQYGLITHHIVSISMNPTSQLIKKRHYRTTLDYLDAIVSLFLDQSQEGQADKIWLDKRIHTGLCCANKHKFAKHYST